LVQVRERSERQLAAIVFTDIVDFSATVHQDEILGERLLERQRTVVRQLIPVYGGIEVETGGDSFLIEFNSALSAVHAVIAIQQELRRVCAAISDDPPVLLRTSIHLGDVEHRGRDLYGDGVNIAARLLPLSPVGGMALSGSVLALVRQRVNLSVQSLGTPALKNIETAPEVFLVDADAIQAITLPQRQRPATPEVVQPAVLDPIGTKLQPAEAPSFFAELQRRDVYRTASIYAVAGWLLVQIATQVFPFFDVPNWVIRAFIVVIVAGFPLALLLSWFYQFTPSGLKREIELPEAAMVTTGVSINAPGRAGGRRTLLIVSALVVLLVSELLIRFLLGNGPATNVPVDTRRSIAVMPFKNLNPNSEHAYLASGIQDEVLTRLARIGSLKVISRASTDFYAAQPADLRKIAKDLNVTHIVEGSVQQAGDSARVAVQLIATDSDSNLWAETYDRPLKDIFSVESEVATAIAAALQAKLTGAQQKELSSLPTRNAKAYDAYLRGLAFDSRTFDRTLLSSAASSLATAVELDPDFALAWARLARVDANRAFYGFDLAQRPCERARDALDNAGRLGPDLGETELARGYVRFMCDDDAHAAEQAFQRARERLPNSAETLRAISQIEWRQGNFKAVIRYLHDAAELDPRNPDLLSSYALYLGNDRQFTEARAIANQVLNITPDDASIIALLASIEQADGNLDAAQKWLGSVPLRAASNDVFDPQILQMLYRGHPGDAIEALNKALSTDLSSIGVNVGDYYMLLATAKRAMGLNDAARETFRLGHDAVKGYDDAGMSDLSSSGIYVRGMLCITAVGVDASAMDSVDCKRTQQVSQSSSQFALTALESLAVANTLANKPGPAVDALKQLLAKPYSSIRYSTSLTPALLRQDPIWASLRTVPVFAALAVSSPDR